MAANAYALDLNLSLIDRSARQRQFGQHPSASSVTTSSQRHSTYDVERNLTSATATRTVQQPAPIHRISEREFARTIADALRRHYGPLKASAKSCARDAGVSPATARNWLDGLCPPSSFFLKKLESKVPGLASEMRRLTALEQDLDPDFQREFVRFMQRVGSA